MSSEVESAIDELIHRRVPGMSLEREFYTSPVVFAHDMERIYFHQWLFAGHVDRVRRPGDYFLYEIAGESLIIIRGEDGVVRGFYNVCRHRGSRICLEECGASRRLVCPYHAWTYDTTGNLTAARHLGGSVDRADFKLREFHVRVVQGLIFVCLSEAAPAFDMIAVDIDKYFAPHDLAAAKIAYQFTHTIRANWKIVAENFWECYHCGPAHPELATVMSYVRAFDSKSAADERATYTEKWKENARRLGRLSDGCESNEGVCHQIWRVPIREGFLTQSRDGKSVAPLMGDYTVYDGGVTSIEFFPLIWLLSCNDYAMLTRFTPISVLETEAQATWLVREDAKEGEDYLVDDVKWLWHATLVEDIEITENNQRGVNSRAYQPGPYSEMEKPIEKLVQWYTRQISP